MLAMADISWDAFLSGPNMFVLCACSMVVLIVGLNLWFRFARTKAETELKHAMIERGMSVEEIERVLRAQSREK